jgi:hypothetical protein
MRSDSCRCQGGVKHGQAFVKARARQEVLGVCPEMEAASSSMHDTTLTTSLRMLTNLGPCEELYKKSDHYLTSFSHKCLVSKRKQSVTYCPDAFSSVSQQHWPRHVNEQLRVSGRTTAARSDKGCVEEATQLMPRCNQWAAGVGGHF